MNPLEQLAGRQVLFLNWRDLSNPAAGGAEAYTEQIARRFAAAGCRLTLFTSAYPGAPPNDWENGYLVVRSGGRFGVYVAAARHVRRYGRQYDAIVDFQNGIPFFAPLWAPATTAVTCVVHHVHQEQFGLYFPWPVSWVGRVLEGRVTRRVYGGRAFVAVSPSTRTQMRRQLRFRMPIFIVPNGADRAPPARGHRSPTPLIAVVTRLVPHKQLHLLVEAVPDLRRRWPSLQVEIAGSGPSREVLQARVRELGVAQSVTLPGRVSDQYKWDLLSRAWLTVAPSLAEGWGLTVLEANAMGTPALAYDVAGLRDSVRDKVTGWLVPPGQGLAAPLAGAIEELADPVRRDLITQQCLSWARGFSWDSSAQRLARVLLAEIMRVEQGSPARRKTCDLATVASWPPGQIDDDMERRLRKALRVTDLIARGEYGLRVLLVHCDELGAAAALARVPVPPATLRLATTADVLCGAGADGLA